MPYQKQVLLYALALPRAINVDDTLGIGAVGGRVRMAGDWFHHAHGGLWSLATAENMPAMTCWHQTRKGV